MNIWEIHCKGNDFATMVIKSDDKFYDQFRFRGQCVLAKWIPPEVRMIKSRKRPLGDFSDVEPLNSLLVCNIRAKNILLPYLKEEVEVLPLHEKAPDYVILNIINVIDCLDVDACVFDRALSDNRISRVETYAFHQEKLDDTFLFRIPQPAVQPIFGTARFRELVQRHHLTGAEFRPLNWASPQQPRQPGGASSPLPPDLAESFNNQGLDFYKRGDKKNSMDMFRSALKIKPDLAAAHQNIGILLAERGDFQEALAYLQQSVSLDDSQATSQYVLGWTLAQLGSFQESEVALRRAVSLDPNHKDARKELEMLLRFSQSRSRQ